MLAPHAPTDTQSSSVHPEFWGAADRLVGAYSDPPERMTIEPYDVDVLAQERRRGFGWCGALGQQLRQLDDYLEDVRRAA